MLKGDLNLLIEAVGLIKYEDKNVRAGAPRKPKEKLQNIQNRCIK